MKCSCYGIGIEIKKSCVANWVRKFGRRGVLEVSWRFSFTFRPNVMFIPKNRILRDLVSQKCENCSFVALGTGSPPYTLNAVYTAVSIPLPTFTALKVNPRKILKSFQHVFLGWKTVQFY